MRRITTLLVSLFLLNIVVNAQNLGLLCSLTSAGGNSTGGVLFGYNVSTKKDSVFYQFSNPGPINPKYNNLLEASDGNFYGVTQHGASQNEGNPGVIFKCTPSGKVSVLFTFNEKLGTPSGSLIQALDGNLYGTTSVGGTKGVGAIFKCTLSGNCTILASFDTANGAYPMGGVIQASDGNLYGMTSSGGSSTYYGTIFKCTMSGVLSTLVNFNKTNGSGANSILLEVSDSNLYGMTSSGGSSNDGTLFKCTTSGIFTTLVNFNNTNGASPYGGLIQASDGNLYGMTSAGGSSSDGTLFKCTTSGTISTLVNFNKTNGANPYGSLIQALDGNLYGLTSAGGTSSEGVLFKCSTSGTISTLVNFNKTNGANPCGSLIQALDSSLYGMTCYGIPPSNKGTIFKYNLATGLKTIYNMGTTAIGNTPYSSPIQASDGNIYGTTMYGGLSGVGTIFQYNTISGRMTTLVNFDSINGEYPISSLIQASDGNLYGTTYSGGALGYGTIFKCSLSGVFSTLVTFNETNGANPWGSLIQAKDGNFYGMTIEGGTDDVGTIFKCTPGGVITVLISFNESNGSTPYGNLLQAFDGNFYGMTYGGGSSGVGNVFKYDTTTKAISTIISFNTTNGQDVTGSLIQAPDSVLYGMATSGGAGTNGTIFKCTTSGGLSTLYNFSSIYGVYPEGSLLMASDGNLYGVSTEGGYGYGMLFRCTVSKTFTNLMDFDTLIGEEPEYSNLIELMGVSISSAVNSCNASTLTANVNGGGSSTYTYLWSTGATTSSISDITIPGKYSVTVKNAKGISVSSSFTVINSGLEVITDSVTNVTCSGCLNGAASVLVKGGDKNVISWSDSTAGGYVVLTNHTTDTATNLAVGKYLVTVIDSCKDIVTDTIRVKQNTITGIQNNAVRNDIIVYPSPCKGVFSVILEGEGYIYLDIYNLTGQNIYSNALIRNTAYKSINIDISSYSTGIYYMKVTAYNSIIYKKILLQK